MTFQWKGSFDFDKAMAAIVRGSRAGVNEVAEDVFDDSQRLVPDAPEPDRDGDLKKSGKVTPQHAASEAAAEISYGTDHAVLQHERLDYEHPEGGTAKYLERPLSAAQNDAGEKIAARIRRELR